MRKIIKNVKRIILTLMAILSLAFSVCQANDTLVYVDNNDIDTKYHRITCSHIFPNGYHAISVEEAFNVGYRRCSDCSPPMSNVEYNERAETAKEIMAQVSNSTNNSYSKTTTSDTRTVYITKTGSKYHLKGCKYLNDTSYITTVTSAEQKGYMPCTLCNPYSLAGSNIETEKNFDNSNVFIIILCMSILAIITYFIIDEALYFKKKEIIKETKEK